MTYLNYKYETLSLLVKKAFKENADTISNVNLLCGYIWKYQGAEADMPMEEFLVGLLEGRFANQNIVAKAQRKVKWEISKEK